MMRACLYCGTEFEVTQTNHWKKYCTERCQQKAKASQLIQRPCVWCGVEFEVARKKTGQKYCSKACGSKASAQSEPIATCTCKQCGKEFKPRERKYNQFCSRECAWEHGFPDRRKAKPEPEPMPTCEVCGQPCPRRGAKTCSRKCQMEAARRANRLYHTARKDTRPRLCAECGREFVPIYGIKKRTYCSAKCLHRAMNRAGKAKRRARKRSGAIEHFNPTAVLERDGWRCYLCGCETPRELRGTTQPSAPELDHIVPLARGGSHTLNNVACCCRACNQAKGDAVTAQGEGGFAALPPSGTVPVAPHAHAPG